jgi:hypothetical protein
MAKAKLSRKGEKALEKYRGHDRSVTVGSCIAPPCTSPFKTGFAASKPRLATDTVVTFPAVRKIVKVPGIYG